MNSITKPNGFSLVEVLIAVFIFAVGLLGIAALQMFAKQNHFDAIQRTTAALLASEIAEKIRANPASAAQYLSSVADLANATLPTQNCTSAAKCTSEQIAAYDLKNWYKGILGASKQNSGGTSRGGLVSPSACITTVVDPVTSAVVGYDIAIAWRGKTPLADPTTSTCGRNAQAGGVNIYGDGNLYRRVLVFSIAI